MHELYNESSFLMDSNKDIHIPTTTATVSAGSAFKLPIKVDAKNSRIAWEFETVSYDIQFGISVVNGKEGVTASSFIFPLSNYLPDQMHTGFTVIEEPGVYELIWDNSHSWLREKKLNYKVDVTRMQMTDNEKSSYNKRIYTVLEAHQKELDILNSKMNELQNKMQAITDEHNSKLSEMDSIQKSLCESDEQIAEAEEEVHSLNTRQQSTQASLHELRMMAPFLVEGDRILSMCSGDDLLRLCSVNHLLYDCVYQDGIWKRVFYQEEKEQLQSVLQNQQLNQLFHLVNPEPIQQKTAEEEKPKEAVQEASESPSDFLSDLSLLYKITEKQGWYKNSKNECFFIRFKDSAKTNYDIIYPAIPSSELDSLIRQTLKSTVLIPMPGTEAGKSGFYIDRFRRVSKWSVESVETEKGKTLKWQEIQL